MCYLQAQVAVSPLRLRFCSLLVFLLYEVVLFSTDNNIIHQGPVIQLTLTLNDALQFSEQIIWYDLNFKTRYSTCSEQYLEIIFGPDQVGVQSHCFLRYPFRSSPSAASPLRTVAFRRAPCRGKVVVVGST